MVALPDELAGKVMLVVFAVRVKSVTLNATRVLRCRNPLVPVTDSE